MKGQLIKMLRNSTDKYKRFYGTSSSQFSKQSKTIKMRNKFHNSPYLESQISLVKISDKHNSTRKLQPINTYKNQKQSFTKRLISQQENEKFPIVDSARRNNIQSDKLDPQRLQKTCEGSKFYPESQSQSLQKLKRNSKDFIDNMPKNTLFFCTHCYQYVFDIEKKRHFPQCIERLAAESRQSSNYFDWVDQKLWKLVYLAKYTQKKPKAIQELYWDIENGHFQLIQKIQYPKNFQFFTLEEIEQAFAFTYHSLLKGKRPQSRRLTCF